MSVFGAYLRLARVGWVLVREGVVSALPTEGLPPLARTAHAFAGLFERRKATRKDRSDRLARAVEPAGNPDRPAVVGGHAAGQWRVGKCQCMVATGQRLGRDGLRIAVTIWARNACYITRIR